MITPCATVTTATLTARAEHIQVDNGTSIQIEEMDLDNENRVLRDLLQELKKAKGKLNVHL